MNDPTKTPRNGGYRYGAKEVQHPVTGAVTARKEHPFELLRKPPFWIPTAGCHLAARESTWLPTQQWA